MELLLLSNSTLPGKAWLEHALPLIAEQLQGRRSAVFIPFAGVTQTWDDMHPAIHLKTVTSF